MAPWSALTDPTRRRRLIVWLSVAIFALGAFYVGANMVTSTAWFCNDVCHVVHLDNAKAYFDSPHSEISCIACHYPVNQDPLSFAFDRVDKLLDIPPTVLGTFHMPMNHLSHLALSTPDEQCVQCHNVSKRDITPSRGLLIDHEVHTDNEITCAACHNRVAHREDDIEIELPDNAKKADFMTMTACFRCHTLTQESPSEYEAPGACPACHAPDFDLVPPSHDAEGWFTLRGESGGHAQAAKDEASRTAEAQELWAEDAPEFHGKEARFFARLAGVSHEVLVDVPPPATVNECFTCHVRDQFCDACHGVEVPHPEGFVGEHGQTFSASEDAESCAICHNDTGSVANDPYTCTLCHHPGYDPPSGPWRTRHDDTVRTQGAGDCFDCHLETYCSSCHVRGEPSTPY